MTPIDRLNKAIDNATRRDLGGVTNVTPAFDRLNKAIDKATDELREACLCHEEVW